MEKIFEKTVFEGVKGGESVPCKLKLVMPDMPEPSASAVAQLAQAYGRVMGAHNLNAQGQETGKAIFSLDGKATTWPKGADYEKYKDKVFVLDLTSEGICELILARSARTGWFDNLDSEILEQITSLYMEKYGVSEKKVHSELKKRNETLIAAYNKRAKKGQKFENIAPAKQPAPDMEVL